VSGGPSATLSDDELTERARVHLGEFVLAKASYTAAAVAAALVTEDGQVFTGVCIDIASGIGFCAEHAAIASMLKHRRTVIRKIVAVDESGVIPPCGRCRELMFQIDRRNLQCEVVLSGENRLLADLLPQPWMG
jgi:cytidine deaminase